MYALPFYMGLDTYFIFIFNVQNNYFIFIFNVQNMFKNPGKKVFDDDKSNRVKMPYRKTFTA